MSGFELTNLTLRPYDNTHGRYWDFGEFEILGRDFVSAFALCFVRYSSSVAKNTAEASYKAVRRLLLFLTGNRETLMPLIRVLESNHTEATTRDWEKALALWRDDLISKPDITPVTKHGYIKNLNTILKNMVGGGVIPDITYLDSLPKALKLSRATPTLAELRPPQIKERSKKILEEVLSGFGETELGHQVKEDFLASLLSEVGDMPGNAVEQAEALFELNRERLKMIRACAVKDFIHWRNYALKGIDLIHGCDLTFDEIAALIDSKPSSSRRRARDLGYLFPKNDQELSLARLLKYFAEHPKYRGLMKWRHGDTVPRWFRRLATRFGGFEQLQDYLFPPSEMAASVITIILCDTGANVSVALTLLRDCLEVSKERGYMVLKGNKMRALGKVIVNELPVKDPANEVSCVEAIQ